MALDDVMITGDFIAIADISFTKRMAPQVQLPENTYTIVVSNNGPDADPAVSADPSYRVRYLNHAWHISVRHHVVIRCGICLGTRRILF